MLRMSLPGNTLKNWSTGKAMRSRGRQKPWAFQLVQEKACTTKVHKMESRKDFPRKFRTDKRKDIFTQQSSLPQDKMKAKQLDGFSSGLDKTMGQEKLYTANSHKVSPPPLEAACCSWELQVG